MISARMALVMLLVLTAAVVVVGAQDTPKPCLKTENFDKDPDWEGHNNRLVPKAFPRVTQDFGYTRTNIAGNAPGEIGGSVQRANEAAFYAAKIAPKTLDDTLSASGTFAITKTTSNTGVFFGWFNSRQPGRTGRPVNSFGMNIGAEPSGARLALHLITAQNQVKGKFITRYERYRTPEERAIKRPTPIKNDGSRYHWKLNYDPAANGGNGQFQFTINSASGTPQEFEGKTVTVDLPAGFKAQGTSFDRFGMMNATKEGSPMTIHFDDLQVDGRKEDFAEDPGWVGAGNRESYQATEVGGAQDFGFRATTSRAGGAAGEFGGIVWRAPYAYYADRVGPFSLHDRLEARGRLFFEVGGLDTGLHIGWFNSRVKAVDDKTPNREKDFIGVDIGGHTRLGHWFLTRCLTAQGGGSFSDHEPLLLQAGTAYEWSFVYDPVANKGNGQMRVTLDGKSATLDLKPGVKAQVKVLDRFGVASVGTGGGPVKVYLDDLQYSASKP